MKVIRSLVGQSRNDDLKIFPVFFIGGRMGNLRGLSSRRGIEWSDGNDGHDQPIAW